MARARRARSKILYDVADESDAEEDENFEADTKPVMERERAAASVAKPRSAATTRVIEGLRERLETFYGSSDADLVAALKLRVKWGDLLFSVSPEHLNTTEAQMPMSPASARYLSGLEAMHSESFKAVSSHSCKVDGMILQPHECRSVENVVCILNVGGSIVSLDWSWHGLIAVSVRVTDTEPINASTVFAPEECPTLIHIYALEGSEAVLRGSLRGEFGLASSLRWRQHGTELGFVLGNGQCGLIRIDSDFRGDAQLQLQPVPAVVPASATQLCWRTPDDIVIGYENGYIAEFCLTSEEWPTYVVRAHSSVITGMASAWPDHAASLATSSIEGLTTVYHDVSDLRLVRHLPRLKFFAPCICYAPAAESFVSLEDYDTTKLSPWRVPELREAQTSLTRHTAGVFTVAASTAHPLVISGSQDGELHIANPMRRTMVTRRNRVHLDCAVWRFECAHKSSEYRFVDLLAASSLAKKKSPDHLPVYPAVVTVTCTAWQPNGTWYAAGTAAGIVRIENVDS